MSRYSIPLRIRLALGLATTAQLIAGASIAAEMPPCPPPEPQLKSTRCLTCSAALVCDSTIKVGLDDPWGTDLPVISVSKAGDGLGSPIIFRNSGIAFNVSAGSPTATSSLQASLPVAARRITSGFGMRYDPILKSYRMHAGVDLASPTGTPIVAPADGFVSHASWRGGYGLLVAVEHTDGLQTRYGHMSRVAVYPGQYVRKGQVLGQVGSTGRSTGPHLHYEIRRNGFIINPLSRFK